MPAVEPGSARPLRFAGATGVLVPPGGEVESDPVALAAAPGSRLSLTVHLTGGVPAGQVTSHPGSRTTSYLCPGDEVDAVALPGATGVDHWYFLSGVRVLAPGPVATAVMVGDSLTDGRGTPPTATTAGRTCSSTGCNETRDRTRGRAQPAAGGTRLGDDDPAGRLVHRARSAPGCGGCWSSRG